MNNPEYVLIDGVKIKIHTDFRYALKCQEIAEDNSINNYEKQLGIIYTLFDEEGINTLCNDEKLLEMAKKYLMGRPSSKKEYVSNKKQEKDMDYEEDMDLIIASMWQEYNIDITKEKLHWWLFFDLLNGLSSECIFNRVREIRNTDISKIKDRTAREQMIELKNKYSLKKKQRVLTEEQKRSVDTFYELTGIKKEV